MLKKNVFIYIFITEKIHILKIKGQLQKRT